MSRTAEKVIYWCGTNKPEVRKWYDSLTRGQQVEIGQLDRVFFAGRAADNSFNRGMMRDWIEEHGGDPDWWYEDFYEEVE